MFGSRDLDSWILARERSAVAEWEASGDQFHIMRDGPFHTSTIHGGLWGADNYINFKKALELRRKLLEVHPHQGYNYDQNILDNNIWPEIR